MKTYIVRTPNGERRWQADDEDHAREQHLDDAAVRDDPGERILDVAEERPD